MTRQFPDVCRRPGRKKKRIIEHEGFGLFDPRDHGVKPYPWISCNSVGYACDYEVSDERLHLVRLSIGLSPEDAASIENGGGPVILGRTPVRVPMPSGRRKGRTFVADEAPMSHEFVVDGLREPIDFFGGILLGLEEVHSRNHLAWSGHPALDWLEVEELVFDAGRLVETRDCSAEVTAIRKKLSEPPDQRTPKERRQEARRLLSECFRFSYHGVSPKPRGPT